MSSTTTSLPLPDVTPDVLAFADKQGVRAYLPAILEMTRRIFPTWPVKVFLEEDAEIAHEWSIVLEVQVSEDATAEKLFDLHQQWGAEIFEHCPSTHVCIFCLGMA
ncbi:MAG: hypothetical protein ACRELF_07985 [Gemmataceae bacterium]